ncbi:MAG: hypothetical protein ACTSXW_02095 [Candidatus Baldrarchaeia archaeon]
MKFSEMWKISNIIYREVQFRALLLQQSTVDLSDIKAVKRLLSSVRIHKILMSIFISIMGVSLAASMYFLESSSINGDIVFGKTVMVSGYFLLIFFIIMFLSLFTSTVFLSVDVFQPVVILPLSDEDLARVTLLAYLRTFDIPAILAIFIFPIILSILSSSMFPFVFGVPLCFIMVSLSATVALYLAKAYFSKIMQSSKSKLKNIGRFILMIMWGILAFGTYAFGSLFMELMPILMRLFNNWPPYLRNVIIIIFPLSLAYIYNVLLTNWLFLAKSTAIAALISTAFSTLLTFYGVRWLMKKITTLPFESMKMPATKHEVPWELKIPISNPLIAVMKRDFRLASRNPSLSFIIIFPIVMFLIYLLPVILGAFTPLFLTSIFGMLIFFYPMFSITLMLVDGKAGMYTFTLPLRNRTLIKAKALLVTVFYFTLAITLVLTSIFFHTPDMYTSMLFIAIAPGIYVSSYIIMSRMVKSFKEEGLSFYEMQKQAVFILFMLITVAFLVGIPVLLYFIIGLESKKLGVILAATLFLSELLITLPIDNKWLKDSL